MPTKSTPQGVEYRVDGRKLFWRPEDDEGGRGTLPEIVLPLRMKMRAIRELSARDLDADTMLTIITEHVAPGYADAIDDMDSNDFTAMFRTWQAEYQALQGVSLGESEGSSS